jgi:hypothetical protein
MTCKKAWEYQWLQEPIPFSEEICETLYKFSQGVNGVMITLLQNSQLLALDEDLETMDIKLLERAYEERMQPLHKAIRALQSGDTTLVDMWDDLSADFWPKERQHEDPASYESVMNEDHDAQTAASRSGRKRSSTINSSAKRESSVLKLTPEQIRAQVIDAVSMKNIIHTLKE